MKSRQLSSPFVNPNSRHCSPLLVNFRLFLITSALVNLAQLSLTLVSSVYLSSPSVTSRYLSLPLVTSRYLSLPLVTSRKSSQLLLTFVNTRLVSSNISTTSRAGLILYRCFFQSTDQFFAEYNQRIPDPFRSTYAPFAYEAMWAIAATLERARPIIEDWQIELYNLDYGRRMVSKIFKEEAIQVHFTGPSVGWFLKFIFGSSDPRYCLTTLL